MVGHDLHWVAFPTLDDIQVATLAKFGTRRPLLDGEALFQAGARDHRPDYLATTATRWCAVNEILRPMAGI